MVETNTILNTEFSHRELQLPCKAKNQALELRSSKSDQRNKTALIALADDVLLVKNEVQMSAMTILHLTDTVDAVGPGYFY